MENFNEKKKKMIGGRVPVEFAEKFSNFCKTEKEGINLGVLFHNLTKWWMGLPASTQEHIYWGRIKEAHEQIAKEEAHGKVARAKAHSSKPQQTQASKRPRTA